MILAILVILVVVILLIFIKPKQNLQAGQQVSLVLNQKMTNFTCNTESGNFGGRNEVYEVWRNTKGDLYIVHLLSQIITKDPSQGTENMTEAKYFDTGSGKEVSGVVQEEDMQYCFNQDFSEYDFCNTTASTCLVIAKP